MHLTHRWLRHLIVLSALPCALSAHAQDAAPGGLQGLPDHELLAVHGAGLDDITLGRIGAARSRERTQERAQERASDRQDGPARDTSRDTNAASAQSQLLVNTVSRQAVQMETTLAWVGASNAVRAAQTAQAGVGMIALASPALAPIALPLMGLPSLPGRH